MEYPAPPRRGDLPGRLGSFGIHLGQARAKTGKAKPTTLVCVLLPGRAMPRTRCPLKDCRHRAANGSGAGSEGA